MHVSRWVPAVAAAAAIALGVVPGAASAQVRVEPQQLPFYARAVTGTGEWTPVIFYRPAGCIPESFNLLSFFDPPRVFGCGPMTVEAFAIWENGPGVDPAPRQGRQRVSARSRSGSCAPRTTRGTRGRRRHDRRAGSPRSPDGSCQPLHRDASSRGGQQQLAGRQRHRDAAGRPLVQAPHHPSRGEGPPTRPGGLRRLTYGADGPPGPEPLPATRALVCPFRRFDRSCQSWKHAPHGSRLRGSLCSGDVGASCVRPVQLGCRRTSSSALHSCRSS